MRAEEDDRPEKVEHKLDIIDCHGVLRVPASRRRYKIGGVTHHQKKKRPHYRKYPARRRQSRLIDDGVLFGEAARRDGGQSADCKRHGQRNEHFFEIDDSYLHMLYPVSQLSAKILCRMGREYSLLRRKG